MKILVTGGAGFIGSHTTDALLQKGYDVRIIDNLEPPVHRNNEKPKYISSDVEFIIGDVRNRGEMEKALHGVDAVYHLAAYQGYLTDFSKFAQVNDYGTALIYEIIVKDKLPIQKVIIASSQASYGEGKYWCPDHGIQYPLPRILEQLRRADWELKCPVCNENMNPAVTDEPIVRPHNQYAASKYAQELYGFALGRRFGIPTVSMRYSITQGPRQSFSNAYSGILRIFTIRLLTNQPMTMYEDGKQLRDYVHVNDVVKANLLVLESERANYEAYNVGGIKPLTVIDFTRLLTKLVGKKAEPRCPGEFRYGDVRHIISDVSKLKSLGWQPGKTIEQNILDYVNWVTLQPEIMDYYAEAESVLRKQGVIQKIQKQ